MDKVIYSKEAPVKSNAAVRVAAFALLMLSVCIALFIAVSLPYSGIWVLVVIFLASMGANTLMKRLVFNITYVLYEDRLVFVREYGKLKWENEVFYLNEAEFFEDKIVVGKSVYPFYPDDELKRLLCK